MEKPSKYHVPMLDVHDTTDGPDGSIVWVMPNHKAINLKYHPKRYKDVEEIIEEKPEKKKAKNNKVKEDAKEEINNTEIPEDDRADIESLSLEDLRIVAKAKGIKGYARMKRETLLTKLK